MLREVRHTGEGSNMADVVAAAPKLGATAYVVTTSDKAKLMALPTPLVAHVEHDHFIAITRITKSQVYYNCSDCGLWPGGFKSVSWKKFAAMECDALAVVTKSERLCTARSADCARAERLPFGLRYDGQRVAFHGGEFFPAHALEPTGPYPQSLQL